MMKRVLRLRRKDVPSGERLSEVQGAFYALSAKSTKNPSIKPYFTCSISKKVALKAVDRNRAKRQCRAAFQEVLEGNRMYMVRIKKSALQASFSDLLREAGALYKSLPLQ